MGETAAWILDIRLVWRPQAHAELTLGVDNLLDRAYAEHLNKSSVFDTTTVRVDDPGRSVWLAASARF